MMQMVETYTQKNSLLNAMNGFIGAVNNMDQTVMVPSLLRDVPLEHEKEQEERSTGNYLRDAEVDMFGYYTQLKAIRNDIQWGALGRAEEMRRKEKESLAQEATRANDNEASEEEQVDLEQLFRFHLKGLHGVLSKLTHQANDLTHRYKQEIGIAGWGQ
ncbi:mid1-interacting protein 1A-like [Clupea harengus]|uniref:Mid1-interacting protein 1A-like n=1 Tax=Clupea harengus TaxID=7950 RepID=A0A8M1KK88_CLUHA|nr:mid1-interacting protein 1A-like [Clupea harengus]